MSLFAIKPIATLRAEAEATGEHALTRALGPLNLVTLGIGAVIGAGIFVITGQVASLYAGPAVPLSMILVGVSCAFAGLCYAEMASAVPVAGSAYTYAYATMGEFAAWIIGWDLVLEYAAGAATVGVGWSGHFVSLLGLFGIRIPASLTAPPTQLCTLAQVTAHAVGCAHPGLNLTGAIVNLPAVAIVALMSAVLVIGIKESARVNSLIVILKVGIVLLVVLVGLPLVRRAARCGSGVFLLHRVRHGLDRGAGVEEPPARHAARHPRLARDLHPAVRRGVGRAGAHGCLRRAQPSGADGVRDGADRRALVDSPRDRSRRGPGRRLRDSRHAAWAVPRLLLDVPRRPARALGRQSPPAVPHAVPLHDLHRHRGLLRNRAVAAAAARDLGQHRHAARVRAGVCRRMYPAKYATRSRATVPCTAGAAGPSCGDPLLSRSHADPSAGHVGAALRVARARACRLFRLRKATQLSAAISPVVPGRPLSRPVTFAHRVNPARFKQGRV